MSKAKKKFASAFADSKMGKSVINKALGPSSEHFMESYKTLLVLFYGKSEGKKIVGNIYKFAVKIRMMFDKVNISLLFC